MSSWVCVIVHWTEDRRPLAASADTVYKHHNPRVLKCLFTPSVPHCVCTRWSSFPSVVCVFYLNSLWINMKNQQWPRVQRHICSLKCSNEMRKIFLEVPSWLTLGPKAISHADCLHDSMRKRSHWGFCFFLKQQDEMKTKIHLMLKTSMGAKKINSLQILAPERVMSSIWRSRKWRKKGLLPGIKLPSKDNICT